MNKKRKELKRPPPSYERQKWTYTFTSLPNSIFNSDVEKGKWCVGFFIPHLNQPVKVPPPPLVFLKRRSSLLLLLLIVRAKRGEQSPPPPPSLPPSPQVCLFRGDKKIRGTFFSPPILFPTFPSKSSSSSSSHRRG